MEDHQPSGGAESRLRDYRERMVARLEKSVERRNFPTSNLEIREQSNGGLGIRGYACVTESRYEVGPWGETIASGAFKRTLGEEPDVQLLINHEGLPLARTKSGTLRLVEDERGLLVDADLDADDPRAVGLARAMRRGDVDQMSFAFRANEQEWNEDKTERLIRSVSIHRGDVSVVNQGANDATFVALRSREAALALRNLGTAGALDAISELRALWALPADERQPTDWLLSQAALVSDDDEERQAFVADVLALPEPPAVETVEPVAVVRAWSSADEQRLYVQRERQRREARALRRLK